MLQFFWLTSFSRQKIVSWQSSTCFSLQSDDLTVSLRQSSQSIRLRAFLHTLASYDVVLHSSSMHEIRVAVARTNTRTVTKAFIAAKNIVILDLYFQLLV